ncbi:hypothetical protein [Flavobacterium selenitireducens]|uniref:hypothetical protein n=1 Tax=Flavobacterium selenitireducens TaxID=2722704 RepID=UPI00168B08D0|nr:hypothetical protein [Flavobacterium selenitireducens]MBD3582846.1 hypothetical protein [Flavobacterium selenitireducens]
MTVEICPCEGLNPKCEKCFGSGYIDSGSTPKSARDQAKPKPVENAKARESLLPDDMDALSRKEMENIAIKLIDTLDAKSKKQMQLLNSIPFNTTTFRIVLKDKFRMLQILESEKKILRAELSAINQEIASKKYTSHYKFRHYLSDKEIDVSSNRQLKDLIREYKKLKNNAS